MSDELGLGGECKLSSRLPSTGLDFLEMEQEIHRIWILVSELSEQLAQNNRVAADLHNQINTLKVGTCCL
jgi:hypothetical protein